MRHVPNLLSVSRLVATAVVFVLVLVNQPWAFLTATMIFFLASITDLFDGYIARRFKVVSSIGVFLDLTADKVFVSAILIGLVQVSLVPAWLVIIIITREFMVAGLRSMAAAKGQVIPAGQWGKQKTFITLVAIGAVLLARGLDGSQLSLFPIKLLFNSQTVTISNLLLLTGDVLLLVAAFWTIMSGIEYFVGALPLFQTEREVKPTV